METGVAVGATVGTSCRRFGFLSRLGLLLEGACVAVAVGGTGVSVGVSTLVSASVGVAVGGTGVSVGATVGVSMGVSVGVFLSPNISRTNSDHTSQQKSCDQ